MAEETQTFGEESDSQAHYQERSVEQSNRGALLGLILILLGVFFLLNRFDLFWWLDWDLFWPLVLILVGAWLVVTRWRDRE
jgi:phage shock protein C